MGCFLSKCTRKDHRVIIIGLDNSGKTTLLYRLKLNQVVNTISTIGFNVETLEYPQHELIVWDLGGTNKLRKRWPLYFPGTELVIFVVDSSDHTRIEEAKHELWKLFTHENLTQAKFLKIGRAHV